MKFFLEKQSSIYRVKYVLSEENKRSIFYTFALILKSLK